MPEQVLFAEPRHPTGTLVGPSIMPTLKLDHVKTQWDAFQSLRRDLESMIDHLGDLTASASQLYANFGITPTTVLRLAAQNKVRKVGRRRKRYHVRDVLLAVLYSGTGRIRRPRSGEGYEKPGHQAGVSVGCDQLCAALAYPMVPDNCGR
jgi:hypothetical protein